MELGMADGLCHHPSRLRRWRRLDGFGPQVEQNMKLWRQLRRARNFAGLRWVKRPATSSGWQPRSNGTSGLRMKQWRFWAWRRARGSIKSFNGKVSWRGSYNQGLFWRTRTQLWELQQTTFLWRPMRDLWYKALEIWPTYKVSWGKMHQRHPGLGSAFCAVSQHSTSSGDFGLVTCELLSWKETHTCADSCFSHAQTPRKVQPFHLDGRSWQEFSKVFSALQMHHVSGTFDYTGSSRKRSGCAVRLTWRFGGFEMRLEPYMVFYVHTWMTCWSLVMRWRQRASSGLERALGLAAWRNPPSLGVARCSRRTNNQVRWRFPWRPITNSSRRSRWTARGGRNQAVHWTLLRWESWRACLDHCNGWWRKWGLTWPLEFPHCSQRSRRWGLCSEPTSWRLRQRSTSTSSWPSRVSTPPQLVWSWWPMLHWATWTRMDALSVLWMRRCAVKVATQWSWVTRTCWRATWATSMWWTSDLIALLEFAGAAMQRRPFQQKKVSMRASWSEDSLQRSATSTSPTRWPTGASARCRWLVWQTPRMSMTDSPWTQDLVHRNPWPFLWRLWGSSWGVQTQRTGGRRVRTSSWMLVPRWWTTVPCVRRYYWADGPSSSRLVSPSRLPRGRRSLRMWQVANYLDEYPVGKMMLWWSSSISWPNAVDGISLMESVWTWRMGLSPFAALSRGSAWGIIPTGPLWLVGWPEGVFSGASWRRRLTSTTCSTCKNSCPWGLQDWWPSSQVEKATGLQAT